MKDVRVGEPAGRILRERVQHDGVEVRRDRGVERRRRLGRLLHLLERDRHRALAVERDPSGEQLEEDDADGVEVGLTGHRLALRLLGREVLRGAHDRPGLGHVRGAGQRDAEVGDLRAVLGVDDHVVRLEVAMDDAALVRELGRAKDLDAEVDRAGGQQRPVLRDDLLQRAALEMLHRDVVGAVPLTAVVHRHDVRVLQAGGTRRLAPEPLDELRVLREAPVQDLQRDITAELQVLGAIHVRHPARADPLEDAIATIDDGLGGQTFIHSATTP